MSVVLLAALLAAAPVSVAHRKVVTDDGAALALHRFSPPGRSSALPPVLLLADVGFGRPLFDFRGRGLARWLAERGRVVYVAELRGQGASSPAHSLRTALHLDLPAVAKALAGEGAVDLVAHGYLGTLALAAAGRELPVRRVVAINTPAAAEPPTELAAVFLGQGGHFSSLASSPEGFAMFEQLFSMGARVDPTVLRAGVAATRDLSPGVAAELLAWAQTGDLPLDDGSTVAERLHHYDRPTLLLLALADGFAPPESCSPLREWAAGPVEVRMFSRVVEGDDFAHASIFLSDRAPAVVFPAIEAFLAEPRP